MSVLPFGRKTHEYKEPQADESARALAARTGQSITDAVVNALRQQLKRETGRILTPRLTEELRAISERCVALPDHDKRSAEEIIGFDEHGLPV